MTTWSPGSRSTSEVEPAGNSRTLCAPISHHTVEGTPLIAMNVFGFEYRVNSVGTCSHEMRVRNDVPVIGLDGGEHVHSDKPDEEAAYGVDVMTVVAIPLLDHRDGAAAAYL